MTSRPVLLDLFCRKGGAAVGYHRAGFDVVGVDIGDHADGYPFEFHRADALDFLDRHGHEFDAVHASPPCQAKCTLTAGNRRRPRLDRHPRRPDPRQSASRLARLSVPTVIENVPGSDLRPDLVLCGLMFGLRVFRHRLFELDRWTTWRLHTPHPPRAPGGRLATRHPPRRRHARRLRRRRRQRHRRRLATAMGIDWMTDRPDLAEAIPPAYTHYIGEALIAATHSTGPARPDSLTPHRQHRSRASAPSTTHPGDTDARLFSVAPQHSGGDLVLLADPATVADTDHRLWLRMRAPDYPSGAPRSKPSAAAPNRSGSPAAPRSTTRDRRRPARTRRGHPRPVRQPPRLGLPGLLGPLRRRRLPPHRRRTRRRRQGRPRHRHRQPAGVPHPHRAVVRAGPHPPAPPRPGVVAAAAAGSSHHDADTRIGTPLDPDSYDYVGAVLWQAHAGPLWHRFAISAPPRPGRRARRPGPRLRASTPGCPTPRSPSTSAAAWSTSTPSSASTAPTGRTTAPPAGLTTDVLDDACGHAHAAHAELTTSRPDGAALDLAWGAQLDIRRITSAPPASRGRRPARSPSPPGRLHRQVRHQRHRQHAKPPTGRSAPSSHIDHLADHRPPPPHDPNLLGPRRPPRTRLRRAEPAPVGTHARLPRPLPHQIPRLLDHVQQIRDDQRAHRLAETLDQLGIPNDDTTLVINDWAWAGAGYRDDAERELAAGIADRIRDDRRNRHHTNHQNKGTHHDETTVHTGTRRLPRRAGQHALPMAHQGYGPAGRRIGKHVRYRPRTWTPGWMGRYRSDGTHTRPLVYPQA